MTVILIFPWPILCRFIGEEIENERSENRNSQATTRGGLCSRLVVSCQHKLVPTPSPSSLCPSVPPLPLFIESTRSHEWDSVVSCHSGHRSAQTWNFQNYVIGRHSLTSKHVESGARPLVSGATTFSSMHYYAHAVNMKFLGLLGVEIFEFIKLLRESLTDSAELSCMYSLP